MNKILEAFKKFKHDIHELDNAEALKVMTPQTTIDDMLNNFSQRTIDFKTTPAFNTALKKQPIVCHTVLNPGEYASTNAQNKVLFHGIMFKTLFDVYTTHLKKGFDDSLLTFLSDTEMVYLLSEYKEKEDKRVFLDFIQYSKLPKRFRGIFIKYDDDSYILNIPTPHMTITYNKKNKQKLEQLLLRARMLIPVIYKNKSEIVWNDEPEAINSNLWTGTKVRTPAFVKDSPAAKCVNDEQLATIRELHDIFIEISQITLPIATSQRKDSAALEILAEYEKETNQQGIFVRAQDNAKEQKSNQDRMIQTAYKDFKRKKKQLKANYKEYHSGLLGMLAQETRINTK